VDLAAATARGIIVTTTGPANAGTVAEYIFALLLALMRSVVQAAGGMRAGL
jgi:lactate dehydrogenase-like 2-hydroxyacid dehydrogenase